eukprot:GHRQ01008954.1.p1 GENE.GHRQ01008954.1~~GHRQ01008954.1.p1  ORF type:complete len:430 (+),score=192.39 GHRQ01008954.1:107-1396(+)
MLQVTLRCCSSCVAPYSNLAQQNPTVLAGQEELQLRRLQAYSSSRNVAACTQQHAALLFSLCVCAAPLLVSETCLSYLLCQYSNDHFHRLPDPLPLLLQVQRCTLLSIKTGGCPENCSYCSQSSHWSEDTGLKAEKLMDLEPVYEAALRAREAGSTRFCMGAAWRGPSQVGPRQWERVLEMVRRIRGLGMEVCTTLGMLTPDQAKQLREAGLTAYNHNLDTSPEFYGKITTTRKYEDRLSTLAAVRDAGISVCAGGIIGLGEGEQDRVGLLLQLATLPEHPESVPINRLVAVKGTPLQNQAPPSGLDLVRCIATARIVMPRTVVRLSAGRLDLSSAEQALAFMAGANSIFDGDKLLTTANNDRNEDEQMFQLLGLRSRPAFLNYPSGNDTSRDFAAAGTPSSSSSSNEASSSGCCGGGCGSKQQQQATA